MPDENDQTTPQDENQPEPEAIDSSQPVEDQADADDASAEPSDEEAAALAAAMAAVSQMQGVADSASSKSSDKGQPFESPVFEETKSNAPKQGMDLLSDVHMNVRIELGRTKMYVEDVLKLSDGAVVELDKLAGDPVDVFVNDRKVARGEVLVLNDLFCVRISEILDISATKT